MSRLTQVVVGPLAAASANNIALSQTAVGAQNLTINGAAATGGVATLDVQRRVIVTSAGNDSGITFTCYGTDAAGSLLQATVAGANIGAADFGVSFKTVTRVATSAATAAAVTVGTNGVADSRPIFLDAFGFGPGYVQASVTGTVNYTVWQSNEDPNGVVCYNIPIGLANITWNPDTILNSLASNSFNVWSASPHLCKVTLNSGTGSVRVTITQHASPSI